MAASDILIIIQINNNIYLNSNKKKHAKSKILTKLHKLAWQCCLKLKKRAGRSPSPFAVVIKFISQDVFQEHQADF